MAIRFWQKWFRKKHEHFWRPASLYGQPVKVCDDCDQLVVIDESEFYTIFGRHYTTLLRNS